MTIHKSYIKRHFKTLYEADYAVAEAKRMHLKALVVVNPKLDEYDVYFWERHITKQSSKFNDFS